MNVLQLFGKKTFPHGIHPFEYKQETRAKKIRRLPFAPEIILPLAQHIGKPSLPIVRRGRDVARGELIATADGPISVPLHASVAGIVEDIALMPGSHGRKLPAIVIRTSPDSGQVPLCGAPRDIAAMPREELIDAVRETGMVGLGGAAFPTHAKMRIPNGHKVHTVIVNGCECEPFLTTDHRVMLESIDALLLGIRIAMKCVGAEKAVIGIEDNKMDAVEAIRPHLPQDRSIAVDVVETKYPQGAEKMLVQSLLGVEIPAGQYPSAIGLSVFNVATLTELGFLLPNRQGLIERVVTISGDDLEKPGNYLVPIGTPLRYILEYAGFTGGEAELILGGPMMGEPAASLDTPVTKGTGAVLVLDKRAARNDSVQPCIKCAACLQACPVNLNPSQLGLLAVKRQYAEMEERYHLDDCFECGCCSYVCPSNIPLVQYFRIAKALNRERRLHG
jgi:electron transport complex protein RnfC